MMKKMIESLLVILIVPLSITNCNQKASKPESMKFQFPEKSLFFRDIRDSANVKIGTYCNFRVNSKHSNGASFNLFSGFLVKARFFLSKRKLYANIFDSDSIETKEILDFNMGEDSSKTIFESDPLLKKRRKTLKLHDIYVANNDSFYCFEINYPDEVSHYDKISTLSIYFIASPKNGILGERLGIFDTKNNKVSFSRTSSMGIFDESHFYNGFMLWEKVRFE